MPVPSGCSRDPRLSFSFCLDALLRHLRIAKISVRVRIRTHVAVPTLVPTITPRPRRVGCVGWILGVVVAFADGIATICSERLPSKLA